MLEYLNKRKGNIWFWLGLVGLFFTTTRIDPSTWTSWDTMFNALKGFIQNPFLIGTFIVALIGQFVDPTTSGLTDK